MGVAQGQTGIAKEVPDEADIAWALALKSASEQVMILPSIQLPTPFPTMPNGGMTKSVHTCGIINIPWVYCITRGAELSTYPVCKIELCCVEYLP